MNDTRIEATIKYLGTVFKYSRVALTCACVDIFFAPVLHTRGNWKIGCDVTSLGKGWLHWEIANYLVYRSSLNCLCRVLNSKILHKNLIYTFIWYSFIHINSRNPKRMDHKVFYCYILPKRATIILIRHHQFSNLGFYHQWRTETRTISSYSNLKGYQTPVGLSTAEALIRVPD